MCSGYLLLQSLLNRAHRVRADGTAIKSIGKYCAKWGRKGWEWKRGGKGVILTCRLYKLWVGIIRDEWNWQIPEVQFKCTSDNIDIFIHIHRNISFFPICVEKALTLKPWKCKQMWNSIQNKNKLLKQTLLKGTQRQILAFISKTEIYGLGSSSFQGENLKHFIKKPILSSFQTITKNAGFFFEKNLPDVAVSIL